MSKELSLHEFFKTDLYSSLQKRNNGWKWKYLRSKIYWKYILVRKDQFSRIVYIKNHFFFHKQNKEKLNSRKAYDIIILRMYLCTYLPEVWNSHPTCEFPTHSLSTSKKFRWITPLKNDKKNNRIIGLSGSYLQTCHPINN